MRTLRVLIAEDTTADFDAIRSHLESMRVEGCRFDVVRTSDGRESLSRMRDEDFALVVLDV